jgi:tetratricopeptide (TPR) repeat protein
VPLAGDRRPGAGADRTRRVVAAPAAGGCEQSLAILEDLGDRVGLAATWDTLGRAHLELADHSQAADCYREAVLLYRELGDRYNEADALVHLGDTRCAADDPADAWGNWQQALDILTGLDHPDAERIRAKLATLPAVAVQPD